MNPLDETSSAKKALLSTLLSPLFTYFDPYLVLLQAIVFLVVFDIISGIAAARKRGEPITSKEFKRKGKTIVLFMFGLAVAKEASPLLIEFGIEAHQAGKWWCAFWGVYEVLSNFENLGAMGMPVAKQFSELLKSKLPEDVKKLTEEKPQE